MVSSHVGRLSALALVGAVLLAASCSAGAAECDGGYVACGSVCCVKCSPSDGTKCVVDSSANSTSSSSGSSSSSGDAGRCRSAFETACDGRCVELNRDIDNCGKCGIVCEPDLAGRPPECFAGKCQ